MSDQVAEDGVCSRVGSRCCEAQGGAGERQRVDGAPEDMWSRPQNLANAASHRVLVRQPQESRVAEAPHRAGAGSSLKQLRLKREERFREQSVALTLL